MSANIQRIAWYTPAEWVKVRAISSDADLMGLTYDEWLQVAESEAQRLQSSGVLLRRCMWRAKPFSPSLDSQTPTQLPMIHASGLSFRPLPNKAAAPNRLFALRFVLAGFFMFCSAPHLRCQAVGERRRSHDL